MTANQGFGRYRISATANLAAYDRLPPEIRAVLARAPYDYACPPWAKRLAKHLAAGGDPAAFRRATIETICADAAAEVTRTWGREHPCRKRFRRPRRPERAA